MALFGNREKLKRKERAPLFVIVTGCAGSGKTTVGRSLARLMSAAYIDKDTVTRQYTDFVLVSNGSHEGDRESVFYCNNLRAIEYEITFKVCLENLELGNDVVVSIPMIAAIRDYDSWASGSIVDIDRLEAMHVEPRFVWLNHDIGAEHDRIVQRGAARDKNKMENWDDYADSVDGIEPDERYGAFIFHNDVDTDFDESVREVLQWLNV